MSDFFNAVQSFRIRHSIPAIHLGDVIQILILAFIIYEVMAFLKKTQAWTLLKGIIIIFLVTVIIKLLNFEVLYWLVSKSLNVFLIALVVVFQPELRSALDRIGRRGFSKVLFSNTEDGDTTLTTESINEIVAACRELSLTKTGVLMAFENEVPLNDFEKSGIPLDARITRQLVMNAFEHNTPLHDGAMVVRGNRIVAATCYFPLSKSPDIDKALGTRHRAAIGITEITDCICLVVSEETGKISVAERGRLEEGITPARLDEILSGLQKKAEVANEKRFKLKGLFKHDKSDQK